MTNNYIRYGIKSGTSINYQLIRVNLISSVTLDATAKTITVNLVSGEVFSFDNAQGSASSDDTTYNDLLKALPQGTGTTSIIIDLPFNR